MHNTNQKQPIYFDNNIWLRKLVCLATPVCYVETGSPHTEAPAGQNHFSIGQKERQGEKGQDLTGELGQIKREPEETQGLIERGDGRFEGDQGESSSLLAFFVLLVLQNVS